MLPRATASPCDVDARSLLFGGLTDGSSARVRRRDHRTQVSRRKGRRPPGRPGHRASQRRTRPRNSCLGAVAAHTPDRDGLSSFVVFPRAQNCNGPCEHIDSGGQPVTGAIRSVYRRSAAGHNYRAEVRFPPADRDGPVGPETDTGGEGLLKALARRSTRRSILRRVLWEDRHSSADGLCLVGALEWKLLLQAQEFEHPHDVG